VVDRAAKDGLTVINEVAGEGVDLRQFHRGVMEYLRAVLLLKSGADAPLGYTEEVRSEMGAQAARASLEHLLRAVKTFAGAEVQRNSSSPLPLELAMVESALDVQAVPAPAEPVPAAAAPRAAPRQAPPAAPARPRPAAPAPRPPHPVEPARQDSRPPAPAGLPSEPLPRLESQWSDILRTLRGRKGKRFDLGALLRSSTERQIADGTVVLKYSHASHKERSEEELADPKSRKILTDILEKAMGGPYDIKVSLADGQASGPKKNAAQRSHMVRAAQAMGAKIVGEREEEPDDE
jgi:DNA polymerase III gamma/tau subunit